MFCIKRIEILYYKDVVYAFLLSLPTRGAWIEIMSFVVSPKIYPIVAPRKGSVD